MLLARETTGLSNLRLLILIAVAQDRPAPTLQILRDDTLLLQEGKDGHWMYRW